MSSSGQVLHERARTLLTLIDGLQIENDLLSSRRTLDDWRTEMLSLINNIHLNTTNRLDSLTGRLQYLKERRSASLQQEILPNLGKMAIERRKNLSDQELNDIKKKIIKIESDLQAFGRLLDKTSQDQKKLVEQMDVLKSNSIECSNLFSLSSPAMLHSRYSTREYPFNRSRSYCVATTSFRVGYWPFTISRFVRRSSFADRRRQSSRPVR